MNWKPQPPKLPGYAPENINPDIAKGAGSVEDTVESLRGELDQLKQFIGIKYTLSNPSSNYASPLDAFYTRAGSLPSYLMTIPYFSLGTQGAFTLSNNAGTGGGGIFSITAGPAISWTTCIVTYNGVQYPISAGNSTLQMIYWQLSSPNIFQASAADPLVALQLQDFVVVEFRVAGAGSWAQVNNSVRVDGARVITTGNSVFGYAANGTLMFKLDNADTVGKLTLWNNAHTAANTIVLDPNVPNITVGGVAITVP